jgi:adenosylhomocysteine nucleosidase
MNVVVTFAVRSELTPWLRLRVFQPVRTEGLPCYETTMAGAEVLAVVTGIGASNAARAICRVLKARLPDVVVASGLAGALKPAYGVGDVLAARLVRSDSADQQVSSSDALLRLAVECGAKAVESLVSANAIVRTVEDKASLGGLAEAVDMESLAILTETRRAGIAAVAVRSVADTAQCDLPCDFSKMVDECGRMRLWRVALEPLRTPQHLPALIRFAIASHRAACRLAGFLDGYIEAVLKSRFLGTGQRV